MVTSGRGVRHKKQTVEGARQLHIAALRQEGVLTAPCGTVWIVPRPGIGETTPSIGVVRTVAQAGQPAIQLDYSLIDQHSGERTYVEELVELTITSCHFGGARPWFRCPELRCGLRVAILYRPTTTSRFRCRHCHQLTYEGRQLHRDRVYEGVGRYDLCLSRLQAAQSKRARLKWFVGLLEAEDQIKAYFKDDQARFKARLERLKRMGGIQDTK